ncbi:hypothetical protein KPL47_04265 [Clostridium estertheticum]|uniref:hypothetical protein n=1 Tax=Clostridium estertheticum TaxID=238834 RepID=UPI001C0E4C7F|nr:hypothetical protein [Clostridium estertheticum]MBU3175577.1 hypothetical protein [Clostridium estertheticum]
MTTLTGEFFQGIIKMSDKGIMYDQILLETEVINDEVSTKRHMFKKLVFDLNNFYKKIIYAGRQIF